MRNKLFTELLNDYLDLREEAKNHECDHDRDRTLHCPEKELQTVGLELDRIFQKLRTTTD